MSLISKTVIQTCQINGQFSSHTDWLLLEGFLKGKEHTEELLGSLAFFKRQVFFPKASILRVKSVLRNECEVFSSISILGYYARNVHTALYVLFHCIFQIYLKFLLGDKENP